MSFPQYAKYKDSEVPWIGKVPVAWSILPLLGLASERGEPNIGMIEDNLLSLSYGRIVRKDIESNDGLLPDSFETYQIIRPGDIVLRLTDLQNDKRSLRSAIAEEQGIITSAYLALRPKDVDPHFLAYLLRAYDITKVFYSMGGGLRQSMKFSDVKRMPVVVPNQEEQAAIVCFLDRETGKIDALVAEQEKLIALLKEKRHALISHAVTKGLDPAVPMKDSGIEWLGKVPAHWDVRKLSSLSTKITNGFVGPTRDILVDDGVRYLQSLHIKGNAIRFDTPYYVRQEWSDAHAKSILEVGDVLIVQTGDIGQAAVVTSEFAGCNCHALIIVAPMRDIVTGEWLSWVFNADYGFHSLLSVQTGALHPHLNCGNVKDLFVPLPPIYEQLRIASYIAEKSQEFDQLTSEAQRAIDLLKERRSALISAAVTGKIDVRAFTQTETA